MDNFLFWKMMTSYENQELKIDCRQEKISIIVNFSSSGFCQSAYFHPHFSIRILSSFCHPSFTLRILPSAIRRHPVLNLQRIFSLSIPSLFCKKIEIARKTEFIEITLLLRIEHLKLKKIRSQINLFQCDVPLEILLLS